MRCQLAISNGAVIGYGLCHSVLTSNQHKAMIRGPLDLGGKVRQGGDGLTDDNCPPKGSYSFCSLHKHQKVSQGQQSAEAVLPARGLHVTECAVRETETGVFVTCVRIY